jgi:ADP-heptose:LPS heptosyltransferase
MKEFSWLFVKEVYPENAKINAVKRNLEVVRYLSNFRQDIKFDLHVPKKLCSDLFKFGISEADKLIGIMPFARGESKKWPKEHYRRLIKLIKEYESGYKVVILGKEDGFEVEKNIKILNLCGKTSFYEMAQILRRCSVVVGNDTGPVQLAAAFNVPAVVIFGGSDVDETAPVSDRLSVITRRYPCSPCRSKPKCSDYPCLNDIKEQEVFEEVKKWIK